MKNTLNRTIGLVLSTVILLAGIIAGSLYYYITARIAETNLNNYKNTVVNNFTENLAIHLWNYDKQAIELVCATLLESREIVGIGVFDEKNHVIFEKRKIIGLNSYDAVKEVRHDGNVIGQFKIAFSKDLLWESKKGVITATGLVVLAIVISFFPLARLLLTRTIVNPIVKLTKSAEIIASGNLDYRIGLNSKDEIGQLSRAFDKMTGELKKTYTSLEQEIGERKHAEKDLQRLNQELEQHIKQLDAANKELEDFSYTVSHDLKAPLRAIDGFSSILLEDYSRLLDDEGKRLLNIIRDNECRMAQLIDDILSFLHFRSMEPKMTEINMEELAQEAWKALEPLNTGRNVQFEVKAMPNAIGDRAMIRQVFVNLLSNAVKFTRPKDIAIIEVGNLTKEYGLWNAEYKKSGEAEDEVRKTMCDIQSTMGELIYYIKDNGIGFDMQYANKLFGVFLRLHHAGEFEGNAVGLAIVKRIIEKHGGRVWAEGKVGEGATFYFTLPHLSARI